MVAVGSVETCSSGSEGEAAVETSAVELCIARSNFWRESTGNSSSSRAGGSCGKSKSCGVRPKCEMSAGMVTSGDWTMELGDASRLRGRLPVESMRHAFEEVGAVLVVSGFVGGGNSLPRRSSKDADDGLSAILAAFRGGL